MKINNLYVLILLQMHFFFSSNLKITIFWPHFTVVPPFRKFTTYTRDRDKTREKVKKYENELKTELGIGILAFCKDNENKDFDFHVRVFFQDLDMMSKGVIVEDSATGSANCALIGYLGGSDKMACDTVKKISQGHYVGRPSCLNVVYTNDGSVKIGGQVVEMMDGYLTLKQ